MADKLQSSISANWRKVPLRRAYRSYSGLARIGTFRAGILQSGTSKGYLYFLLPDFSPSATTSPITGGRVVVTP